MSSVIAWAHRNRRVIALKVCVAVALTVAHFFPDSRVALATNLVWLFLF